MRAQLQIAKESRLQCNVLPPRYVDVSQRLWQGKWLQSYAAKDNIHLALQRIALRCPRMAPLADGGRR